MRHSRATGRHGRYLSPVPFRVFLAFLTALITGLSLAGLTGVFTFAASAQTGHARVIRNAAAAVFPAMRDRPVPRLKAFFPAGQALRLYTVRAGDTMSGVARSACGHADDWTGIYAASRAAHLTAVNANVLRIGQSLVIDCADRPGELRYASATAWSGFAVLTSSYSHSGSQKAWSGTPAMHSGLYGRPYYCGDGDGDGWDMPCQRPAGYQATAAGTATYTGSSSMQQCIIARESGGNSQVMNSSGHYGLYQFSYSTWTGSGGNGADFGHASVAEQNQVFANAVAARGYSDWTPYDGC